MDSRGWGQFQENRMIGFIETSGNSNFLVKQSVMGMENVAYLEFSLSWKPGFALIVKGMQYGEAKNAINRELTSK